MAKFATKTREEPENDAGTESESFFTRGEEAAKEARQQTASSFRPEFWMLDGECAEVIFLDKESYNIIMHQLKVRGKVRKYTCRRKGCPLCRTDEPRVYSVYRILDLRQFVSKDDKGKKTKSDFRQKYYEAGSRVQPTIAKLLDKGLLFKQVSEISRSGSGTNTTYQIIPTGPIDPAFRDKLRAKGLMKHQLDIKADYAPKSVEDLEMLAQMFGGADDDDETPTHRHGAGGKNSAATGATATRRNYLEDADDDDEAASTDADDEA